MLKHIRNRSKECSEAIKLRVQQNPKTVTMIKSELIADVDYQVNFTGAVDAQVKTEILSTAAASLGAKVISNDSSSSHLTGQNLVWGVVDDAVLGMFGINLPSTGGAPADRQILKGKGAIERTESAAVARRTYSSNKTSVRWDVPPMKQVTSMGCWATVYTMMLSWKQKRVVPVTDALTSLGGDYLDSYLHDTGLPSGAERGFATLSMVAEPPASYTLAFWRETLGRYGPLWVTLGDGINSHALLLVGIYGSGDGTSKADYDDSEFEFIDPASGSYTYQPALSFMNRFEAEAALIVAVGGSVDLRWQIIHWRA
ncbi:papain-like cysteine protease family protein [Asticcacaulis benevestitus]|nr:papain-like cysteine protease family protein [Asticcacaulis benevestitus]